MVVMSFLFSMVANYHPLLNVGCNAPARTPHRAAEEGKIMKERPILFSSPMIRAILAGQKTQTRRVIKPQPMLEPARASNYGELGFMWESNSGKAGIFMPSNFKCKYGNVGDSLWVRETFARIWKQDGCIDVERECPCDGCETEYRADTESAVPGGWDAIDKEDWGEDTPRWKPSIHMRREYSRINLEIIGLRVEHLQDITGVDILREGVRNSYSNPKMGERFESMQRMAFQELWEKINGPDSWIKNPWVWVVEFKRSAFLGAGGCTDSQHPQPAIKTAGVL